MKIQKKQKLSWGIFIGLLLVILIGLMFGIKEGIENPLAATVKCMDKGLNVIAIILVAKD